VIKMAGSTIPVGLPLPARSRSRTVRSSKTLADVRALILADQHEDLRPAWWRAAVAVWPAFHDVTIGSLPHATKLGLRF
jgi:hypothetical protein